MRIRRQLVLGVALSLSLFGQEPTGSISGTLQVSDGKPSGAVSVGYMRMAPVNHSAPKPTAVTSAANGNFTLSGLAGGTYMICVRSSPTATLLDPCVWSTAPTIINLLPGQTLTGITIPVQRAATLQIQVSDPAGALANNEGKSANGYFSLGIATPSHILVHGAISTQAAAARTYQLAVPMGTPLSLTMNTQIYQVQNADLGVAVSPGTIKSNFTIPSGTALQTFNLKIVGVTAQ